jgi:hypothetical protein
VRHNTSVSGEGTIVVALGNGSATNASQAGQILATGDMYLEISLNGQQYSGTRVALNFYDPSIPPQISTARAQPGESSPFAAAKCTGIDRVSVQSHPSEMYVVLHIICDA